MNPKQILIFTAVILANIHIVQAISYPCAYNSICAKDVTLYQIWETLGNITDEYTQFIYFPSNNTFIANATFLGHNITINDATVKNFRKWIGSKEPVNHFHVKNVTFYGAPDSFGYYTFFENVTIYGYGLNDTSSITGDLINVTIYNASVTITSHGTVEELTVYNSDMQINGDKIYNSTFMNSSISHPSTGYNFKNVQYTNSSVTLPSDMAMSSAYFYNSTTYLPRSSFTINNAYFDESTEIYAVGSHGEIKNATILGRLSFSYISTVFDLSLIHI